MTKDYPPPAPSRPPQIFVEDTHLVIAPSGNPTIRLDARLLDRVELVGRSPTTAYAVAGVAAVGAIGTAVALVPGGVLACLAFAFVTRDRFVEARRRTGSRDLLLALGDLEVALHISDGPVVARQLVDALAPYTRHAPITDASVYEDAVRRLQSTSEERQSAALHREAAGALSVGDDSVRVEDGFLKVGAVAFRIEDVRDHALRGANLPLSGGRLLQAAMGLLVVAAAERANNGEDRDQLAARIAAYEGWSGRTAGR